MSQGNAELVSRHLDALAIAAREAASAAPVVDEWAQRLAAVFAAGGKLLACGNGGSAAEAQHLTGELLGRFREERRPLPAIALTADSSAVTAIVNDYGAAELFARQVEAHARPGDVVVLMSTSGRSPNIVAAGERARALGITTWGFTGPVPNPLAAACDEVLAIDAATTATIQELHLVALHVMCAALDEALEDFASTVSTGESV